MVVDLTGSPPASPKIKVEDDIEDDARSATQPLDEVASSDTADNASDSAETKRERGGPEDEQVRKFRQDWSEAAGDLGLNEKRVKRQKEKLDKKLDN